MLVVGEGGSSTDIRKEGDLFAALELHKPGDVVELRVKRGTEDGKERRRRWWRGRGVTLL